MPPVKCSFHRRRNPARPSLGTSFSASRIYTLCKHQYVLPRFYTRVADGPIAGDPNDFQGSQKKLSSITAISPQTSSKRPTRPRQTDRPVSHYCDRIMSSPHYHVALYSIIPITILALNIPTDHKSFTQPYSPESMTVSLKARELK